MLLKEDTFSQSPLNSKVVSSTEKKHITAYELAKAFAAADIPINKLDHPQLRQCLEKILFQALFYQVFQLYENN